MAAESVETTIQHVVGDGGQRVITILTDQHSNLQPAALGQQFIITLQGQQSEWATHRLRTQYFNTGQDPTENRGALTWQVSKKAEIYHK